MESLLLWLKRSLFTRVKKNVEKTSTFQELVLYPRFQGRGLIGFLIADHSLFARCSETKFA